MNLSLLNLSLNISLGPPRAVAGGDGRNLGWLPADERAWLAQHRPALERIYAAFDETGEWPDPVQLQRELRAEGTRIDIRAAVASMPPLLGWRAWSPPRVVLTVFGIGCCPQSSPLIADYHRAAQLALIRFDSAGLANRLSRKDVVSSLGLNRRRADRLSQLILSDGALLAGGNANLDSWDQAISDRVVEFEDVNTPEQLLPHLAEMKGLVVETARGGRRDRLAGAWARMRRRAAAALSPQRFTGAVLVGVVTTLIAAVILAIVGLPDL